MRLQTSVFRLLQQPSNAGIAAHPHKCGHEELCDRGNENAKLLFAEHDIPVEPGSVHDPEGGKEELAGVNCNATHIEICHQKEKACELRDCAKTSRLCRHFRYCKASLLASRQVQKERGTIRNAGM